MLEDLVNFLFKFFQSLGSFFKILLRSNIFLKKNYKPIDNSCIILGNGPSLKKVLSEQFDHIERKVIWCVNNFPNTEYFTKIKPDYFLFISTAYFRPDKIKYAQEVRDSIIKSLVEKTNWNLIVYCPKEARQNNGFVKYLESNPFLEIRYFNKTPVSGLSSFNKFYFKRGWGMPRPHNVLIPALLMAINIGYKKIYLVGADHSWLPLISVNDKNEALVNQQHFYKDESESNGVMYQNNEPRKLHQILEKFMFSFRSYFHLQDYASAQQCHIFNCTPNSFIDAFDRKKLSDINDGKSQKENNLATK
jgi:hypothetical protein